MINNLKDLNVLFAPINLMTKLLENNLIYIGDYADKIFEYYKKINIILIKEVKKKKFINSICLSIKTSLEVRIFQKSNFLDLLKIKDRKEYSKSNLFGQKIQRRKKVIKM